MYQCMYRSHVNMIGMPTLLSCLSDYGCMNIRIYIYMYVPYVRLDLCSSICSCICSYVCTLYALFTLYGCMNY